MLRRNIVLLFIALVACSSSPSFKDQQSPLAVTASETAQYMNKNCTYGNASACYFLGEAFEAGWAGLDKDLERSKKFLQQACRDGIEQACSVEGFLSNDLNEALSIWLANPSEVTKLNLSRQNVRRLPDALFTLTALETLILSDTNIAVLPGKIRELKNLKNLNISRTRLSYLPESIIELQQLETLIAEELCIVNPQTIHMLSQLPNLKHLSIRRCPIPPEITQLQQLESLSIAGGGELYNLKTQLEYLTHLPNLHSLDISGRAIHDLPDNIGELKGLKNLNISYNSYQELPKSIVNLQKLERLYVSVKSPIGQQITTKFPHELLQLSNLKFLWVDGDFEVIPEGLSFLERLEELRISSYKLTILPSDIIQMSQLHTLSLSNCSLSTFPLELLENNDLRSLELSYNYKLREQIGTLLEHHGMTTMENLGLTALGTEQLIFSPQNFPKLQRLDLSYSQLKVIPTGISEFPQLSFFDFSHNQLESIPDWLYEKGSLQRIELGGNRALSIEEVKKIRYR